MTGVRKCSTSAFYGLLSSLPGSVKLIYKENCAFMGSRSLIEYFESLPEFVSPGGLIKDGCVDTEGNMKVRSHVTRLAEQFVAVTIQINLQMRELLRYPKTFYLVSQIVTPF